MRTIDEIYSRFADIVCDGEFGGGWRRICRILRVCPSTLDEILFRELGMSGEELLSELSLKD